VSSGLRDKLRIVIFEADTPAGKAFDIALILCIVSSVSVVMLDSMEGIRSQYGPWLYVLEWMFTLLFTLEYLTRIACIGRPTKYMTSFFGIVDLLAILPTYLSLAFAGSHYMAVIRVLRVLRIFRILKIAQYVSEADVLLRAMRASRRKIVVFLFTILSLVIVLGSLMYLIESKEAGFTSIPRSIYWAIVTLTTVGYGDISPQTSLGQALASVAMILGYSIIAVPTGIVTVEITRASRRLTTTKVCPACSAEGHDDDAAYCKFCGEHLGDGDATTP
jgi:voltage-gated potassium channel